MVSRVPRCLCLLVLSAVAAVPCAAEWIFMPPDHPPGGEASFSFVDGTSFEDVWAVGIYQPDGWRCLAEHFDGQSWSRCPLPDDPANAGVLAGVAAVSPDRAFAVGTHTPVGYWAQPLAMEWDGSDWTLVPAPEREGGRVFSAVDYTATGEIWVAGYEAERAFLARREGEDWQIIFAPPVGSFRNRFYAMHARADNEIWVVGTQSDGFGEFEILLQRYDGGSSWTTFDVPSPNTLDEMQDVVAFDANDAWAVGYYYHVPLYLYQPLILHYDGTSWTMVDLPEYPEGSARLEGIAATTPDCIYAAGTYATADGIPRPFMLHYDGLSWAKVALPPTGGRAEWFQGMTATPDQAIWAVGTYFDGTSTAPMAFVNPPGTDAVSTSPGAALSLWPTPNPFRSGVYVQFSLDRPGRVDLRIWDAAGRQVRTLVERNIQAGRHVVLWNGLDSGGWSVPPGTYFYRLEAPGGTVHGKVTRIR